MGTNGRLSAHVLLAAGYARYNDEFTAAVLRRSYQGSYMLRFADGTGIRYAIAVHHGFRLDGPLAERGEFFCPEGQFTRAGLRFNAEVLWKAETLPEIEAFFEDLWRSMRLDYAEGPDGAAGFSQPLH